MRTDDGGFIPVTPENPCPICGSSDWCMLDERTGYVLCNREDAGAIKQARAGGHVHRLIDAPGAYIPIIGHAITPRRLSLCTLRMMQRRLLLDARYGARHRLAAELGLKVSSLKALEVGWYPRARCWTFPMRDSCRRLVGFRTRNELGEKRCIAGGSEGLFIPRRLPASFADEPLFITEGPTDCAAVLSLGLWAVGRPSCTGGIYTLTRFIQRTHAREIVLFADNDNPGLRGAKRLCNAIRSFVKCVRFVSPPKQFKDVRAWYCAGLTRRRFLPHVKDFPRCARVRLLARSKKRKEGKRARQI
jgi:hypothetical protein